LGELFETYWLPVYAFIRRSGYDANRASDLTQGFFVSVMERGLIGKADQNRGRFRTFLLVAVKGFLASETRAAKTLKRGGRQHIVSIDAAKGDERIGLEPQVSMPPDREFQRQWALTVLQRALDELAAEFERRDRAKLFHAIKPLLTGDREETSSAELAHRLDMSESAIKVAIHRMRKRYRELIRLEVAQTVNTEDEVQDELNELLAALGT
jgi:RNA polymerase sigma-70 factor (ECF subfamily)